MRAKTNIAPPDDDGRREFHEEGARSYVQVATALFEYQRQVQKKCRNALRHHISDYSRALGISLSPQTMKDYSAPEPRKWDATWAELGTKIGVGDPSKGIAWLELFDCLEWDYTDPDPLPSFGVCVGVWLPRKASSVLYREMQRVHAQELSDEYSELVCVYRRLKESDAFTFEYPLNALFENWIRSFKAIGGLKKILP